MFLLDHAIVLTDGSSTRELPRETRVIIRHAPRGGETSRAWLHLMVRAEGEREQDVPTELTEPALAIVTEWLERKT